MILPPFVIQPQPDDTSCGPTCLHAVYRHYGADVPLERLLVEVPRLAEGGTLGVLLGLDALARGYETDLYVFNLRLFDPTWFRSETTNLAAKLRAQMEAKGDEKFRLACQAYAEFVERGGKLRFTDLTRALLRKELTSGHPIVTGLSSTYLYRSPREVFADGRQIDDDVRGEPTGHFVVLVGYEPNAKEVRIADPDTSHPFGDPTYHVHIDRVIGAILLGVLTYDANLLIIKPKSKGPRS